ncbi:MAG: hypothetical protein JW818_18780 [Pirellulales bacterium]|nr:hypothetical protein [Pirellulales bacterium]
MSRTALSLGFVTLLLITNTTPASEFRSQWPDDVTRPWVGPEYWANRLEDWRLHDGRLECIAPEPYRTVHLLTRQLGPKPGEFSMRVTVGCGGTAGAFPSADDSAGFLIGAGGKVLDYRAASLVHHSPGPGGGILAGIDGAGKLFFRDNARRGTKPGGQRANVPAKFEVAADKSGSDQLTTPESRLMRGVELVLTATPQSEKKYTLTLSAHHPADPKMPPLAKIVLRNVPAPVLIGNLALFASQPSAGDAPGFWFRDWQVSGDKVETHDDRAFGPILCALHTLSRGVLKMTAQLPPLAENDTDTARLEIRHSADEPWRKVDSQKIVAPGWTVPFRIENWDSTQGADYRIVYDLHQSGGKTKQITYEGHIRPDPVDKQTITVAGLACVCHINRYKYRVERRMAWTPEAVWFPHQEVVDNLAKQKPDIYFFVGDQIYEGASPTVPVKSPVDKAMLDYLYKWYMWCWMYHDLIRDTPTSCQPDDHDVFQGNLWGCGGRHADRQDDGGYLMPPEFVNMVERTQTSHLPDPYDPTPVAQGIGVYYCPLTYGRISFAILEDRKFKSCATPLVPEAKIINGHITIDGYDPKKLDVPGAILMGDRQLKFLREWATDWKDADMKVAVSQTILANVATTHANERLAADCDSNGWPQTGRNQALDALRRGFAFMIAGDQHLGSLIHHGIKQYGDAGYSLCVPATANFYPRKWDPAKPGGNHQEGMPPYTGDYLDGFGNRITVYAIANPGKSGRQPADMYDRAPGYGILKLDKKNRTVTVECWPRYADPTVPDAKQFPGWPRTINQLDNYGRKPAGYLPRLKFVGMKNPVVQVIDEATNEVVYTIRAKDAEFRPKVFKADGSYTLRMGEPGTQHTAELKGLEIDNEGMVEVEIP